MNPLAPLAQRAWWAASLPDHAAFARALRDPRAAQEAILARTLARAADTRFGRAHGFGALRGLEAYAARVPARDHAAFAADLAAVARGEARVLTGEPVRRLQPTGGSSGGAKWIPLTAALQREFARAVAPWLVDLARQHPAVLGGRAYWGITPAVAPPPDPTRRVPAGFEEDSAYLGGVLGPLVAATLAVPGAMARVADLARFRRLTLLHLLHASDLRLVSVWHPSFLTLMLDALRADWDGLLAELARGVRTGTPALDLAPAPRRARALAAAGPDAPARLWPHLALVSAWGDAAAAPAFAALGGRCAGIATQPKGLIATEAIVSVPYRGTHPLAITSHVLEFEDAAGAIRPAWALETGGTYAVLVTTGGGLYRYRLEDRVAVTGFLERTPCVRFLGKLDRVSDRFGEKLDEAFVAGVVARALETAGGAADFALLAPEVRGATTRYVLHVAPRGALPAGLAAALEAGLRRDPQYAYAVDLGQLAPAAVCVVGADASARYLERLRAAGARLGDIKPAALSPLDGWREALGGAADPVHGA